MERRALCPNCGARPRLASKVTRKNEILEKSWWCPDCGAVIEITPGADKGLDPVEADDLGDGFNRGTN